MAPVTSIRVPGFEEMGKENKTMKCTFCNSDLEVISINMECGHQSRKSAIFEYRCTGCITNINHTVHDDKEIKKEFFVA